MFPEGEVLKESRISDPEEAENLIQEISKKSFSGYITLKNSNKIYCLVKDGQIKNIKTDDKENQKHINTKTTDEKNGHIERNGLTEILSAGEYRVSVVECPEQSIEILKVKFRNGSVKVNKDDPRRSLREGVMGEGGSCYIITVYGDSVGIVTMVEGVPDSAKFVSREGVRIGNRALEKILRVIERRDADTEIYQLTEEEKKEIESETEIVSEHIEEELEGISESFEQKADELLDDMGLDTMKENGGDDK